jgi:hypothetical protein
MELTQEQMDRLTELKAKSELTEEEKAELALLEPVETVKEKGQ